MDALLRAARRRRTIAAHVLTPCSLTSLAVFWQAALFVWLEAAPDAARFSGSLVALAVYFAVAGLWVGAHHLGLAGAGTGAGLRLAAGALAARVAVDLFVVVFGFDGPESVHDAWPTLAPWTWLLRNVGLACFAYGLSLTAFASLADAVRRRRHPAWVASLED